MRRIVSILCSTLLLGAGLALAGCVVVPARGPVRVWVPGYWANPHVWVEGHWRYR
ncbi:hypothetical protein DEO45_03915 [Rhodanobacter denitrificans]|uniref:YXWGXW repeat-containing protein n=1 Tax=Rhodanobacter denitrificans TaxID=666685 RepID=A0A368KGD5_9GAMM|nr:YXWGXW repeat-containing protein [Rhodanobacter denitrificans]RCS30907.1 hypothetical protein DEO45_03915 [Rhodanobacter denitrificans]